MVPSTLPVQPAGNTSKTVTAKTDTVAPTEVGSTVSARVSAFLASDTATEKTTNRPDRPPPPPGGGKGPEGAGGSQASSETETALLLLEAEAEEDVETDEADDDTDTQTTALLFDEAKTYYPASIY